MHTAAGRLSALGGGAAAQLLGEGLLGQLAALAVLRGRGRRGQGCEKFVGYARGAMVAVCRFTKACAEPNAEHWVNFSDATPIYRVPDVHAVSCAITQPSTM